MFCPSCGKQLPNGSTFCSSCGKQIQTNSGFPLLNTALPTETQDTRVVDSSGNSTDYNMFMDAFNKASAEKKNQGQRRMSVEGYDNHYVRENSNMQRSASSTSENRDNHDSSRMICLKCGNQIDTESINCPFCGYPIEKSSGVSEKKIVKSIYAYNAKKIAILTFVGFSCIDFLMLLVYSLIEYPTGFHDYYDPFWKMWTTEYRIWSPANIGDALEDLFIPAIIILILGIVLAFIINGFKSDLTVTDKRVYGMGNFKKRVDLPLDSISSIGSSSFFKGVSIATSSGSIKFFGIKNYKEIYEVMSKLLIARQDQIKKETPYQFVQSISTAEELKKYKDLLDSGVITKEEFDAKKKQLLGL